MNMFQDSLVDHAEPETSQLAHVIRNADEVLVKKLSNNDRDWARYSNKHQDGVYMPPAQRDSGFFPALTAKERDDPKKAAIREVFFTTNWPQYDIEGKQTRLVHYTSKGPETHLTRLPKVAFSNLSPASFLVMVRGENGAYICLTVDSASDDALLLADTLELKPDFLIGIHHPALIRVRGQETVLSFVEQAISAWLAGEISSFAEGRAAIPPTITMAKLAREKFLATNNLRKLDPFTMPCPGDALREISRGIEWELFRDYQRRERAIELVRIILGDQPVPVNAPKVIRNLIERVGDVDSIMLSASQQRKSRAGYSFEHHIESMLIGGKVPFEKQVVIEAKKRPDFVLPSLKGLRALSGGQARGMILSAKTTLRERWKQVEREMGQSELFLATVDENIAANAIDDMATMGVTLVVPETLKASKIAEYAGRKNVISFSDFFKSEISIRMKNWL